MSTVGSDRIRLTKFFACWIVWAEMAVGSATLKRLSFWKPSEFSAVENPLRFGLNSFIRFGSVMNLRQLPLPPIDHETPRPCWKKSRSLIAFREKSLNSICLQVSSARHQRQKRRLLTWVSRPLHRSHRYHQVSNGVQMLGRWHFFDPVHLYRKRTVRTYTLAELSVNDRDIIQRPEKCHVLTSFLKLIW